MPTPKGGYSAEDSAAGTPEIVLSFLMFAQFFPLALFRKASETYSFETEEAGKRQLASLLDIRVGQLKFANAKQLKAHFRHSGPELALPRQVILVVHADLRTLTASADILLYLGAKPKKSHWLEPTSLSAALLLTAARPSCDEPPSGTIVGAGQLPVLRKQPGFFGHTPCWRVLALQQVPRRPRALPPGASRRRGLPLWGGAGKDHPGVDAALCDQERPC
ncbi:lon2 [Symbiodinium microadriaticum]|nr:lon2 [Symbiodinium microadriaticum]